MSYSSYGGTYGMSLENLRKQLLENSRASIKNINHVSKQITNLENKIHDLEETNKRLENKITALEETNKLLLENILKLVNKKQ